MTSIFEGTQPSKTRPKFQSKQPGHLGSRYILTCIYIYIYMYLFTLYTMKSEIFQVHLFLKLCESDLCQSNAVIDTKLMEMKSGKLTS